MKLNIKFTFYCLFLYCIKIDAQTRKGTQPATATTPPGIEQVVETFYERYSLADSAVTLVQFEKKNRDWFVTTLYFDKLTAIRQTTRKYYDGNRRVYLPMPFHLVDRASPLLAADTQVPVDYTRYIDSYDAKNFDLHSYYNYPDWFNDEINYLEKIRSLSDQQLYALARAYSVKAISYLTDQQVNIGNKHRFSLPYRPQALTATQEKIYLRAQDSAISKFKKLADRTPRYETLVGDSRMRYANEVLVRFHSLLTFSPSGIGNLKWPENLYNDSVLSRTTALLNKCPQGSILLSYGDNDFYPVLYLQHVKNVRRDIHIVNYNLLSLDHYAYRATLPQFDAPGIRMMSDTSLLRNMASQVVMITDSTNTVLLPNFIRRLQNWDKDAVSYPSFTARALRIRQHWGDGEKQTIDIKLDGQGYLTRNQWLIFDILNNLQGRKFCVPYLFNDDLSSLNEYFIEGDGFWMYDN